MDSNESFSLSPYVDNHLVAEQTTVLQTFPWCCRLPLRIGEIYYARLYFHC